MADYNWDSPEDIDDMNGMDDAGDMDSYMNMPSDEILTSSLINRIENSSLETQRMVWHLLNALEHPADFDEPLDDLERRVRDWWEHDDLSGVVKSSSSRGSLALLSDASVRTIWDYCKYLGISPATDKQENVKAIWNCLKEHPQYLAYIFTWEEIKDLQEFFRLRNGVSNHQPKDETIAKAISLGFLDAKEEEYNRSIRFVLRQTKDAPKLLGTLSVEEWQTTCENGQKTKKQCLQLLDMYGVMELSAFCEKYREYYDTGAKDEDILRCIYLSGSFCRELLTATTEDGISYASLPEIDLSQILEIWEQEDIGAMEYRPMSPMECSSFEKGICERYPEWKLFNQYLDVNYEMNEEEEPGEWLHELYYAIVDGESLSEFCEEFYENECLERVDEFVIFWNLAIGAYIRTGLPQYKGYSREEYAKLKDIPLSQLFGEEDFVDSITETTHLYQMPPEIQLEVHEIQSHENDYRYQKRRYETLLPKLPNGNCEIEFYYAAALFNAEDFIGARKYYKRILRYYPGDDTTTSMLNYTLQNLQKQREKKEEENLTLWDRMTDMARRGELADIMPQGNPSTYRREQPKIGRNDPCPCGSGKKYKNCCGR